MSRFDYVKYDPIAAPDQKRAKDLFEALESYLGAFKEGRAKALAMTKLEESYMWIGKAIRDEQIARNGFAELQEERNNE